MKIRDESLRKELLRMGQRDQEVRAKVIEWMRQLGLNDPARVKRMNAPPVTRLRTVDHENTARLKEIIAQYGWPGRSLVGTDGSQMAWLLAQHADADPAFQKHCLERMREAVRKGEASRTDLAYLTDRVLVAEKRKQLYGTQVVERGGKQVAYPIRDERNVDRRRAQVGLEPLAEYLKSENHMYGGTGSEH